MCPLNVSPVARSGLLRTFFKVVLRLSYASLYTTTIKDDNKFKKYVFHKYGVLFYNVLQLNYIKNDLKCSAWADLFDTVNTTTAAVLIVNGPIVRVPIATQQTTMANEWWIASWSWNRRRKGRGTGKFIDQDTIALTKCSVGGALIVNEMLNQWHLNSPQESLLIS